MILLITNKDDITTDFVVNKLNKAGSNYFRFNTEELLSKIGVNFNLKRNEYLLIDHANNFALDLSSVQSVYFRRPLLPNIDELSLPMPEARYVLREINFVMEGLYKFLKECFWISPVFSIREAENKIYQLQLAHQIGFAIPNSIITTLYEKAIDFINSNNYDCIIKPIRDGIIGSEDNSDIIFTNPLGKENLNVLDTIDKCPTYIQNKINKVADIRVTVVGRKVFVTKIYSQEYDETRIDWRKGQNFHLRHERINLPSDLEVKCIELVERLGLCFGAIDLALTREGEYIFFEINPNGQWGWIEKRLGYDISGEIVRLLQERGIRN